MSEAASDILTVRELATRIDGNIANAAKLYAEQVKLLAEQRKLNAEADTLRRDRYLAPMLAAGALAGAVAAVLPIILRAWGVH